MKRQKETIGSIVEINVYGVYGLYYCYAQILAHGNLAFFDYRSKGHIETLSILNNCNLLFIICVYKDIITQGYWLKVGKLPIREELQVAPMQYIYHKFDKLQFELYDPNTGEIRPSTKEECRGLERCAVWDKHHVEDRLRDYYNGVPCIWLKEDYEIFKD